MDNYLDDNWTWTVLWTANVLHSRGLNFTEGHGACDSLSGFKFNYCGNFVQYLLYLI